MSVEQLSFLDDWKRPEEALPPPLWARNIPLTVLEQQTKAYMVASNLVDLVQDAATDCSIVASMSAGIARAERGFPDVSWLKLRNILPIPRLSCACNIDLENAYQVLILHQRHFHAVLKQPMVG